MSRPGDVGGGRGGHSGRTVCRRVERNVHNPLGAYIPQMCRRTRGPRVPGRSHGDASKGRGRSGAGVDSIMDAVAAFGAAPTVSGLRTIGIRLAAASPPRYRSPRRWATSGPIFSHPDERPPSPLAATSASRAICRCSPSVIRTSAVSPSPASCRVSRSTGGPKVTVTGCGRGHERSRGIASNVPSMIGRDDGHRVLQEQAADAGKKALQPAVRRAPRFGEPDEASCRGPAPCPPSPAWRAAHARRPERCAPPDRGGASPVH